LKCAIIEAPPVDKHNDIPSTKPANTFYSYLITIIKLTSKVNLVSGFDV